MKEEELRAYRIKIRLRLQQEALTQLSAALLKRPDLAPVLRDWAGAFQVWLDQQTIPQLDPARSDMLTAEWQEAGKEMFRSMGL